MLEKIWKIYGIIGIMAIVLAVLFLISLIYIRMIKSYSTTVKYWDTDIAYRPDANPVLRFSSSNKEVTVFKTNNEILRECLLKPVG